ncbi:MAG: carboxypeptidase-like regulatory domain-containing protein [Pirellulales bacterium]
MTISAWFVRFRLTGWLIRFNILWFIGSLCGCAPEVSGPETFSTVGVVTLDGSPVGNADITFHPSSGESEIGGGYAITDEDGSYRATIFVDGGKSTKPGLPAGDYDVDVVKLEQVAGDASLSKPPRNILPARYGFTKSSELKVTVSAEGENQFDFHLSQ